MDMWLVNQDEFEHLTPDDYASGDAFSTPDDLEGYPQAEDRFLKYSEDPPALIAYVAYLPTVPGRRLTVWFSVMGVTGSGKTTVKRANHPIYCYHP